MRTWHIERVLSSAGMRTVTLRPWRSPANTVAPWTPGPSRNGATLFGSIVIFSRSVSSRPSGAIARFAVS